MILVQNDNTDKAMAIYSSFKRQEGSLHIASPISIRALIDICREHMPERILEVGGGIGTLTYALLACGSGHVDVYEDNAFCIEKLQGNLSGYEHRYTLLNDYQKEPPQKTYDLIIIDGGNALLAGRLASYIGRRGVIYVEGSRYTYRFAVIKTLLYTHTLSSKRCRRKTIEGKSLKGGIIFYCNADKKGARWLQNRLIYFREYSLWKIHRVYNSSLVDYVLKHKLHLKKY